MRQMEKTALIKALGKTAATEVSVFSVTETDRKSAETAVDAAKALIAKKKADYAIVVMRK